ncbi:hypothetical protein AB0L82_36245 [Nocardia sp. NPDC052001]|uniref:hypothetical protein n=1 Tax=Nocardia sp. NPDC052001 TaxID=3154853 RepID=UPI00342CD45A
MRATVHPLSSELLTALQDPVQSASILQHLDECLACRVRMSRIRRAEGIPDPGGNSVQRIIEASTPAPTVITELMTARREGDPAAGELWRVGRDEALLVWVRRVFDDGIADVVPVVLDVDLADGQTLILDSSASSLGVEIAAMVVLRTHISTAAFLNRVGVLDIRQDIEELIAAGREGREPRDVRVGQPIVDPDDQRFEYRQALRDLLADLDPEEWAEETEANSGVSSADIEVASSDLIDMDSVKLELGSRLFGIQCVDVPDRFLPIDEYSRIESLFKARFLDETVLVVRLIGSDSEIVTVQKDLAEACHQMAMLESDVDAVAVARAVQDPGAILMTTADMRSAIAVPQGNRVGPSATLSGLGLVDLLCKHLDASVALWESGIETSGSIQASNLREIAAKHVNSSVEQVLREGLRARQEAKKSSWSNLSGAFGNGVLNMIVDVVNGRDIDNVFAELGLDASDD